MLVSLAGVTMNLLLAVLFSLILRFLFSANPTWLSGEVGSILSLQGGNLNMMVFSWAQLGYLLIEAKSGGKVRLYRQMEMGNERSAFEQRCFKQLFGRRDTVDAGSVRYGEEG